jgi:hypothetical protein
MSAQTSLGPTVHATIHDGPNPRTCRQPRRFGGCQRWRRIEVQTEPRTPATSNTQSDRLRHDERFRTPGDRRTQLRPDNSHGLFSHPRGARPGHPESTNIRWRRFGRVAGLSKLSTTMRRSSSPSPPQSDFLHASFDQSHRSFSRASVRVPACNRRAIATSGSPPRVMHHEGPNSPATQRKRVVQ